MPPKRSSTGSISEPAAKMARTQETSNGESSASAVYSAALPAAAAPGPAPAPAPAPARPRNSRWSRVSASGNADAAYHQRMEEDRERAYSYICMCRRLFESHNDRRDDDEDEFDEDEDDEDEDGEGDGDQTDRPEVQKSKNRCDHGKTCVCNKPAAEHPDHPYVTTYAAKQKYLTMHIMCDLRLPDLFDMYTFNDHEAYGVLEVVQNLLLDYQEAGENWKEKWVVCETMAQVLHGMMSDPMMMADDGETIFATHSLIGRMFLNMLEILAEKGHLRPDSEVKDLGLVMAYYVEIAHEELSNGYYRAEHTLSTDEYAATKFGAFILAYAKKYNITVPLLPKYTEELDELEVPEQSTPQDAWMFDASLRKYSKLHVVGSFRPRRAARIGGDSLDITTWTAAERRSHHFENRDPLGRQVLDAIKEGLIVQIG